MKFIIILLAILVITFGDESEFDPESEPSLGFASEVNVENVVKSFVDKAEKYFEKATASIEGVSNLTKKRVEELVSKAKEDIESINKEVQDLFTKFNKIKDKSERDLKECTEKLAGRKSSLGQLSELSKDLDEIIEDIKKCPTETISGMGCTLGKVLRGEGAMEEIDGIVDAETGSDEERAEAIIQSVESCNENAVSTAKVAIKEFIAEIQEISSV